MKLTVISGGTILLDCGASTPVALKARNIYSSPQSDHNPNPLELQLNGCSAAITC
jgi:hypothetical protein